MVEERNRNWGLLKGKLPNWIVAYGLDSASLSEKGYASSYYALKQNGGPVKEAMKWDDFVLALKQSNPSGKTIERIERAFQIISPKSFVHAFRLRLFGNTCVIKLKKVKSDVVLRNFLTKIEQVRPVVEKLVSKAKRKGLRAKLELHPLLDTLPFPTLVFRDKEGPVFWTNLEPTGTSLLVRHIQGLECKTRDVEDPKKLKRVQGALAAMAYGRLRDGLFADICNAATGKFMRAHYQHPSKDENFKGPHDLFHGLARRMKLNKTATRATKVLPRRK